MTRMSGALVAAVAVWMSTASAAPQRVPDFSGRWTTDAEPGRALPPPVGAQPIARGDMGSGWGSTITITQQTQLVVEYTFFGRGDMQPPLKFVYALDGSDCSPSPPGLRASPPWALASSPRSDWFGATSSRQ
jgi:hypothetical protein